LSTQLHVNCKTQDYATKKVRRLTACIAQLVEWMTSNRLKLNSDKTQFIWISSRQQLANVTTTEIALKDYSIATLRCVTCLGVDLDDELTFATHMKRVSARCFYQLCQLWSIRPALSANNVKMLVHAFVCQSRGLLQQHLVASCGRPPTSSSICAQRCSASRGQKTEMFTSLQMSAPACHSFLHVTFHPTGGNRNPSASFCGPLMPVIWPHREQELWALVHEVSRLLAHQCGTVFRQSSRPRH